MTIELKNKIVEFCNEFKSSSIKVERYLFGINDYSKNIAELIDVDGFIDEYTTDDFYNGKKIIKKVTQES